MSYVCGHAKKKLIKYFCLFGVAGFLGYFYFLSCAYASREMYQGQQLSWHIIRILRQKMNFYRENSPSHTHKMKNRSQGDVLYTNYD